MKKRNRHNNKILIEEATRAMRLLGPIEIGVVGTVGKGAMGTTRIRAVGTVGTAVALNPSGKSMIT